MLSYTVCKTLGHAWDIIPNKEKRGYRHVITLRCVRCSGERIDGLDWRGDLLFRYYAMPKDYKYAIKVPRNELRLEMIRQLKRS